MQELPKLSRSSEILKFLESCKKSSTEAYEALKKILLRLHNPLQRKEARQFLHELQLYLKHYDTSSDVLAAYSFSIDDICISSGLPDEKDEYLTLLQLPSIFSPEEWSFTFFEGLSRYPLSAFRHKTMTELGSGNGWISIALAKRYMPLKIYGLDINPRAQICGRINLYLNGLDASGAPIFDEEGKTVLDRVEFHTSDLLEYAIENRILLDYVVGCIPQVLNPDEEAMQQIVQETATDEYLYDLSNYCGKQGYVEDQFGLGLIARTLEESLECVSPSGKIILNMGGRPGSAVLDRLFQRRGFAIKKVWHRKILQASDTDISPLVQIEKKSPHRFEFFMGQNSHEPISATTAMHYAQSGGDIAHSLTVYECTLDRHAEIRKIFGLLKNERYTEAKSALDLYFEHESVAEEKINFLASLADTIAQTSFIPYADTEGESVFRKRIADFLRSYFNMPLQRENIVVAPNNVSILRNLVHLYRPALLLSDKDFIKDLPRNEYTQLLEVPRNAHLIIELIQKLKPQMAFVKLADFQYKTPDAFIRLLDVSEKIGTSLVVDISSHFELSSMPSANGIFEYISENPLPKHVSILCGLTQNNVYRDLEMAFIISENKDFLYHLTSAAEFTYSRTPFFAQNYYSVLLHELLKFQIPKARQQQRTLRPLQTENKAHQAQFLLVGETAQKAFSHPSIASLQWGLQENTIRLDYGENEFDCPEELKLRIFEAFVRQHITQEEQNPSPEIKQILQRRFGIDAKMEACLLYGSGIAPLFAALAEAAAQQNAVFLFPSGCYGYFYATAQFFGVKIVEIPTHAENQFKVASQDLDHLLSEYPNAWVFLNAPIVNPTGAVYTSQELKALFDVLKGCKVVIDTIFSGLEHHKTLEKYDFESIFSSSEIDVVLLGGVSKEFAAAGLRFGYAYTRSVLLQDAIQQNLRAVPHFTIRFMMKKLYADVLSNQSTLIEALHYQRHQLQKRSAALLEVLYEMGWKPLEAKGGLFMVARPLGLEGKKCSYQTPEGTKTVLLNSENIAEALFFQTNLLINNSVWTGIPNYCRFVLSVSEDAFQRGIKALRSFEVESK